MSMFQTELDHSSSSDWYSALHLQERAELSDYNVPSLEPGSLAERRLGRWLETPAFQSKSNLIDFLHSHHLGEKEFCAAIGDAPPSVAGKLTHAPEWLEDFLSISQAYEANYPAYPIPSDSLFFFHLTAPLITKHPNS